MSSTAPTRPSTTDESFWGIELNEDRIATTYLTDDIIVPEG